MLRIYDVKGKLLNRIKSMYVNSVGCIEVKWSESECFRVDIGVRHFPLAFQCVYGCIYEKSENGNLKEGREWR